MLALLVSLIALTVLGGMSWLPRWFEADSGIHSVEPSLLTVAPEARGIATLGDGYTVALYGSGFRYAFEGEPLADTVTRGAPVVALFGRLDLDRSPDDPTAHRESVEAVLSDVEFTRVEIRPGLVTYTGTVSGVRDGVARRMPLRWQVALSRGALHTTVSVPGADALVLSLDLRPNVRGIAGQLPERNLRNRAWWFEPSASAGPAFTWMNPSTVGLGPAGAARAIDLSVDGRIDLHVWRDSARLVITPSAGSD